MRERESDLFKAVSGEVAVGDAGDCGVGERGGACFVRENCREREPKGEEDVEKLRSRRSGDSERGRSPKSVVARRSGLGL